MSAYQGFIGGSYTSQSPILDCEECINWYVERAESEAAKWPGALYPTPGVALLAETAFGASRGYFAQDGRAFCVIGTAFYEAFDAGGGTVTLTFRGSVVDDGKLVTFASNGDGGNQLFFASGRIGYLYNLSTNAAPVATISDSDVCGFLDSYFLSLDANTSTLRISEPEDGATWDPTQTAQRTAGSDRWVGMLVNNRQIWLLGSRTSEVWYNSGASPFPFQPIQEMFMQHGTRAANSLARVDNAVVWLGEDEQGGGIVWMGRGPSPTRISNHAVEFAIQGYSTTTDAEAFSYQDQGHSFYVLSFPTMNVTWCFDQATQLWHKRAYRDPTTGAMQTWRVRCHCFAFGKHLVGDRVNGNLYDLSITHYSDVGGVAIRRLRRAPHLASDGNRLFFPRFQVDLETGLGLTSGQGSNPLIMMRYSNDGGHSWSNTRQITAGAIGQYKTRAIFWKCGEARDRVFEISVTDPIAWRLVGAWLDVTQGMAA